MGVEGEAPHKPTETHSLMTRGAAGSENAATRIPIRLNLRNPTYLPLLLQEVRRRAGGFYDFLHVMKAMQLCDMANFELLYVVMPRYGNLISGLEADAPGGTAQLGESRLQVANREFEEEAGLQQLCVFDPFPSWLQFSSGCYTEVQRIDFALVLGNPKKLVEGASRWGSVPLDQFEVWVKQQNNPDDSSGWVTTTFVPVDGKVGLSTMWLIDRIKLLLLPI